MAFIRPITPVAVSEADRAENVVRHTFYLCDLTAHHAPCRGSIRRAGLRHRSLMFSIFVRVGPSPRSHAGACAELSEILTPAVHLDRIQYFRMCLVSLRSPAWWNSERMPVICRSRCM